MQFCISSTFNACLSVGKLHCVQWNYVDLSPCSKSEHLIGTLARMSAQVGALATQMRTRQFEVRRQSRHSANVNSTMLWKSIIVLICFLCQKLICRLFVSIIIYLLRSVSSPVF